MARNKGTFNFSANFEVLNKAPLDARVVVDTKSNLTTPSTWQDLSNNIWLYKGIIVSVVSDPDLNNNGLYFLSDEVNYTNIDNWKKLNSTIIDASGTPYTTWQINNTNNGVILKDSSGNLEIVSSDASTYANLMAGEISVNSLKIDNLNGILYAINGNITTLENSHILKAYNAELIGNGITSNFVVDHSLNTINQQITIYDNNNYVIYPDLQRGLNTNNIKFSSPIEIGEIYEIIILGF